MPRVYRVAIPRYAQEMWTGLGCLTDPSRWLPSGYPAVYASGSVALAVLEKLVNAPKPWPIELHWGWLEIPDDAVERVEAKRLPADWNDVSRRGPGALWDIGVGWFKGGGLALEVPSAVVPVEYNYVLNTTHKAFADLTRSKPLPMRVDPRL